LVRLFTNSIFPSLVIYDGDYPALHQNDAAVFFYAKTTDGEIEWRGDTEDNFEGQTYGFMNVDKAVGHQALDDDGNNTLSFTCE
jgi:hypothetical protein